MNITDYGLMAEDTNLDLNSVARITAVHRNRYELISNHGCFFAQLKSSEYYHENNSTFPTVGDFVQFQYIETGDSLILKTLTRRTKFARSDFSSESATKLNGEQVVAANFDYVFIMVSLNYDFNLRRIERYLALAWQSGATPVIILTKTDLMKEYANQLISVQGIAIGVDVVPISALIRDGLSSLEKYLQPQKTVVFLGSSGVGKSTLVNALTEDNTMEISEIREEDSRGRHTTTHRELVMLKNGAMIIDTPGMREVTMLDAEDGIKTTFQDVESYFGNCRFSDCQHQAEPGCAVREAIASGELPEKRWKYYLTLQRESKYHTDKAAYMKDMKERFRTIAKYQRKETSSSKNNGF